MMNQKECAPQSSSEMLVGSEQVEARGDHLQNHQGDGDRQNPPEAAERIDAAEEAGENRDQHIGLAVANPH